MTFRRDESEIVEKIAEDYRRRGYDVEVEPKGSRLPEFLDGFEPDLIARSASDSVVVEVKIGTQISVVERLRDIAERVNTQPGWRFSLVFVNPARPDEWVEATPPAMPLLQERVGKADALIAADQREAAFLLLWSALEGILRVLADRARLPLASLPPSALIRELYSAGEISGSQFESLMRLLPIRNRLVHGFDPEGDVDVEMVRTLVHALLAETRAA